MLVAAGEDHQVGLCRRLRERRPQIGRVGPGRGTGTRRKCLLDRRRVDAVLEHQDGAVGDGCSSTSSQRVQDDHRTNSEQERLRADETAARRFAPAAGRSDSQSLPLSDAKAIFDASSSVTRRLTSLVLADEPTPALLPRRTTSTSCTISRMTGRA